MRSTLLLSSLFEVAVLLAAVPFAHADVSGAHRRSLKHSHLRHLRLQQRALPTGWSLVGCYLDNVGGKTLTSASYTDTVNMTVESCVNFCNNQNYIYAGVEYAQECYCGNLISNGGAPAPSSDCNLPCKGNASELCGAGNRLDLYTSGATPPPPPTIVPSSGSWVSLGCYSDNVNGKALTFGTPPVGGASNNSVESCTAACFTAGYSLAGVEYSDECYCGNTVSNGGAPAPASGCSMTCSGNSSEFCGGPNRLNVYNNTASPTSSGPSPPTTTPIIVPSSGPWVSLGCYSDNVGGRALTFGAPIVGGASNNSVESCTAACLAAGYSLAGMEYSDECYCGNIVSNGGAPTPASDCSMACSGNSSEFCGGPNRLNVYNNTASAPAPPTTTPIIVPSSGPWVSLGCYSDNVGGRALTFGTPPIGGASNNSVESCTDACFTAGYGLAGVEYSDECYCGSAVSNGGAPAASGCSMVCSGNSSEICGGPNRLNVYNYTGTGLPQSGTVNPNARPGRRSVRV